MADVGGVSWGISPLQPEGSWCQDLRGGACCGCWWISAGASLPGTPLNLFAIPGPAECLARTTRTQVPSRRRGLLPDSPFCTRSPHRRPCFGQGDDLDGQDIVHSTSLYLSPAQMILVPGMDVLSALVSVIISCDTLVVLTRD